MANTYKTDIAVLDNDYSGGVIAAYNAAKQQLSQVHTANLEGTDRALPDDLGNQLDGMYTKFTQEKPQKLAELTPKRDDLKKRHLIFLAVKLALIIIGLVIAFSNSDAAGFGWVLLIAGVVCHFVFSSMDQKSASALSDEWQAFFAAYQGIFGHKETLHSPATGLYKKVDDLYLRSLDDQQRGFELQNRQMQKQMEAQNEQHQQAMAMQAAQMAQMQEMVNEQRYTNSMLHR